jgi:hypothetical protein
MLLVQKLPISYQESPKDNTATYVNRHIRSSRDLSTTSREGRFLFKFGAKQLQNLLLWTSLLTNSAGVGTISATNSFNLFGKTINAALSLAYGNRGFIPPGIPPPVPPVLPFVPPVLPVTPPIQRGVPPILGPTVPLVPLISPVTTIANSEAPPLLFPITTNVGPAITPFPASVTNGNTRIIPGSGQTDASQRQLLEEYLELEKRNQKLLSEYNNLIKQQQQITINQNEQWKQFLKTHNLMVDQFNDQTYINVQRANEI